MQQNTVQRSTFFRPNRPGNLTISDLNEAAPSQQSSLPLQQQQQQQQPQSPYITQQQPYGLGQPTNSYNTSYSNSNQQPLPSPHFQQPLRSPHVSQQQAYNRVSPSTSYLASPSANTGSNNYQQYSPSCNPQLAPPPPPPPLPPPHTPTMNNSGQSIMTNSNGHALASPLPPPQSAGGMMSTGSYDTSQQSYTPKYSPCASSALLVNKQPQYFSFDQQHINSFNAPSSQAPTNMVASSPSHFTGNQQQQQQQQYMIPHSPLPNQQPKPMQQLQPPASPHYNVQQQQQAPQQQQQSFQSQYHSQFGAGNQHNQSHYYSQMPSTPTPASALPILTSTPSNYHVNNKYVQSGPFSNVNGQMQSHHGLQHSHSVPSSPLVNQNGSNQNSVFKFSTNHINMALQGNTTPTVVRCYQQSQPDQSMSGAGMISAQSKQNSFEFETSEVINGSSGLAQTAAAGGPIGSSDDQIGKAAKDDASLVTTKTYSEKDIEMVSEVFQDIMQKEDQNSVNSGQYGMMDASASGAGAAVANDDESMLAGGLEDAAAAAAGMVVEPIVDQSMPSMMGSQALLADENDGGQVKAMGGGVVVNVPAISSRGGDVPSQISLVEDNLGSYDDHVQDSGHQTSQLGSSMVGLDAASTQGSSEMLIGHHQPMMMSDASVSAKMSMNSTPQMLIGGMNKSSMSSKPSTSHSNSAHKLPKPQQQQQHQVQAQSLQQQSRMNRNSRPQSNGMMGADEGLLNQYQTDPMSGMRGSRDHGGLGKSRKYEMGGSPSVSYGYGGGASDLDSGLNSLDASLLDQNTDSQSHDGQSDYLSMLGGGGGGGAGGVQKCPDCNKEFTNKSALAKHRLIHSNERKYSCHLCDKSFKRQDHLNGHMLTHQDKKPFECKAPGCDKSYCDSRSLKRHVESQHQDYLASLATGNSDALNYLPSIGKIKANLAPNLQQEIIVQDGTCVNSYINVIGMDGQPNPSSTIALGGGLLPFAPADPVINPGRPKNFFTFEEPKPEKCKFCGKGFKNIPALNGHMRLHGGVVKQPSSSRSGANSVNGEAYPNEDSNSSNTSFTSFTFPNSQQSQPKLSSAMPTLNEPLKESKQTLPPETGFLGMFKTIYDKQRTQTYGAGGMTSSDIKLNEDAMLASKTLSQMKATANAMKAAKKPGMYGGYGDATGGLMNPAGPYVDSAAALLAQNFGRNFPGTDRSQFAPIFNNPSDFFTTLNGKNGKMTPNNDSENDMYVGSKQPRSIKREETDYQSYLYAESHASQLRKSPATGASGPLGGGGGQKTSAQWPGSVQSDHGSESGSAVVENEAQKSRQRASFESSPSKKVKLGAADSEGFNAEAFLHGDANFQRSQSSIEPRLSEQIKMLTSAVQKRFLDNINEQTQQQQQQQNHVSSGVKKPEAETPVMVSSSNQETSSNAAASSKQKVKPGPLTIPETINSLAGNPQTAANALIGGLSNFYPNLTLLKSPRFNNETKKQYTPPPMLSPFRKGPGLFCKLLSMFPIPPLYNRTASGSTTLPPLFTSYIPSPTPYTKPPLADPTTLLPADAAGGNKTSSLAAAENSKDATNLNSAHSSGFTPRPSLLRQRLMSQSSNPGTFFPDTAKDDSSVLSDESIISALNVPDQKPFVNEGAEYQATIPKWRESNEREKEKISLKEDLMWDYRVLDKVPNAQFEEYLKLICKSTMVYGSSNNMELGLHILSYYGDIKRAIKPFLDNTIELPKDHPISEYKYPETDIWTEKEVKLFEEALLKYDKCFPDVAEEVGTKTTKQCIEYYYLWKKIKSDSMKKKWKKVKKRHHFDSNFEPSNLRSHSAAHNEDNDESGFEPAAVVAEPRKRAKTTTAAPSENLNDGLTNGETSHEHESKVGHLTYNYEDNYESLNEIKNQEKYECVKCNLTFRTNQKLKHHMSAKHS